MVYVYGDSLRRRVSYGDPVSTPDPGMRHMGAEVRMVIRGESLAHRLLRSRLMFLLVATVLISAARCSGSPRS